MLRRAARAGPGRLDLVHVHNSGVAFGFLGDGGALLVVGAALALLALVAYFARTPSGRCCGCRPACCSAGRIGNLIDRATQG